MHIKEVFSPPEIIAVQKLAFEIWNEYYPSIIGQSQVDYMLSHFQTAKAILNNINEGHFYFLLIKDEQSIGYFSIQNKNGTLFMSKLYIHKNSRRQGHAKKALLFIKDYAHKEGLSQISLTVNINNQIAIKTYEGLGFIKTGELLVDIGNGFKMDDYTYELKC